MYKFIKLISVPDPHRTLMPFVRWWLCWYSLI